MAEKFKNLDAPDSSRIIMNDEHQVRHWAETLGCGKDELATAVARVGDSSDAVRREIFRLGHTGQSGATLLSHGEEDDGDPGEVAEGWVSVEDDPIRRGSAWPLRKDENPLDAARRLLRERGFTAPISYPTLFTLA
jgi:uncharacterized protein DUF3606